MLEPLGLVPLLGLGLLFSPAILRGRRREREGKKRERKKEPIKEKDEREGKK
jgi:hypothetical protein